MDLYYTPGNDVILPCDNTSSLNSSCSIITWFYNRDNSETTEMVWNGVIMENSAQAARLSLYSNCSLGIRNIVAEDAGLYCCRSGNTTAQDTNVGLHILNSEYLDFNDSQTPQLCSLHFCLIKLTAYTEHSASNNCRLTNCESGKDLIKHHITVLIWALKRFQIHADL